GSCLKIDSQTELKFAGLVNLRQNFSEVRGTLLSHRRSKLHAVEDIEELGAELHVGSLAQTCRFHHGKIVVIDAGGGQVGVDTWFVAKGVVAWVCEAGRVEPFIQAAFC